MKQRPNPLPEYDAQTAIDGLAQALAALKDASEIRAFLEDLCTPAELEAMGDRWRRRVKVGDLVLVCDVGGGTTDFSLIAVGERDGELTLERVAVGDHILLGGDNMDMLLAHIVERKLVADAEAAGRSLELDRWQRISLQHAARGAKERLLGDAKATSAPIAIASKGSKLVGGTLRTELTREEVQLAIVDGFSWSVDSTQPGTVILREDQPNSPKAVDSTLPASFRK